MFILRIYVHFCPIRKRAVKLWVQLNSHRDFMSSQRQHSFFCLDFSALSNWIFFISYLTADKVPYLCWQIKLWATSKRSDHWSWAELTQDFISVERVRICCCECQFNLQTVFTHPCFPQARSLITTSTILLLSLVSPCAFLGFLLRLW